jgi:hypothetical protein
MTAMLAFIGFMTLFPDLYVPFWVILTLPFIASAPLIAVTVTSGQGGCRIKLKDAAGGAAGRRAPYFNAADSYKGNAARLEKLRAALTKAVLDEEYEKAAELRDLIKSIENSLTGEKKNEGA